MIVFETLKNLENVFVKHYAPSHMLVYKYGVLFPNKGHNSVNVFLNSLVKR